MTAYTPDRSRRPPGVQPQSCCRALALSVSPPPHAFAAKMRSHLAPSQRRSRSSAVVSGCRRCRLQLVRLRLVPMHRSWLRLVWGVASGSTWVAGEFGITRKDSNRLESRFHMYSIYVFILFVRFITDTFSDELLRSSAVKDRVILKHIC